MNVYDVKYHVYDIKYYRNEPEHIDYINRFNDKVKPNTILYTWETHKRRDSVKLIH